MIPVLTRAQMRAYDRYAIETCHVPGMVLMENAGRGAADVISGLIDPRWAPAHAPDRRAPDAPWRPHLQRRLLPQLVYYHRCTDTRDGPRRQLH